MISSWGSTPGKANGSRLSAGSRFCRSLLNGLGSDDLSEPPRRHIVDEAANRDVGRNQWIRADRFEIAPDTFIHVAEGKEVNRRGIGIEILLELVANLLVGEGQHAAIGVVDHHKLRACPAACRK